jgi:hypothetical protein
MASAGVIAVTKWSIAFGRYRLVALTRSEDLFICARKLLDEANRTHSFDGYEERLSAASLLADQQNKSSDGYQKGNQNTDDQRNNPMPTVRALASLDGTTNGSAGINGAPDLGAQRCGDHEDRGDSTNYRKFGEHNLSLPWASYARQSTRRTFKAFAQPASC